MNERMVASQPKTLPHLSASRENATRAIGTASRVAPTPVQAGDPSSIDRRLFAPGLGQPAQGIWKLKIAGMVQDDTGVLVKWSLAAGYRYKEPA